MSNDQAPALKLKVTEALNKDVGRAYARMGPEDLEKLGSAIGDIVEVTGKRTTVCKSMPAYRELRDQSRVQLDGIVRENAGAGSTTPSKCARRSAGRRSRLCLRRSTSPPPSAT